MPKTSFLYAAIEDTQGTIRALDMKLGFLLAVAVVPLPGLPYMITALRHLVCAECVLQSALIIGGSTLFLLCWLVAMFAAFRGLQGIDNPAHHIRDTGRAEGSFYAGGLYPLSAYDAVATRVRYGQLNVEQHLARLPDSEPAVWRELAFEQLKLAYIRDVKMRRQKTAFDALSLWLILGAVLWSVTALNVAR